MEFQWPARGREGRPRDPVQGRSGLDGDPWQDPYSGIGCTKALRAPAHSSGRAASSQTMSIASWICFSSIVSAALFSGSWTSLTLTSLDLAGGTPDKRSASTSFCSTALQGRVLDLARRYRDDFAPDTSKERRGCRCTFATPKPRTRSFAFPSGTFRA